MVNKTKWAKLIIKGNIIIKNKTKILNNKGNTNKLLDHPNFVHAFLICRLEAKAV